MKNSTATKDDIISTLNYRNKTLRTELIKQTEKIRKLNDQIFRMANEIIELKKKLT